MNSFVVKRPPSRPLSIGSKLFRVVRTEQERKAAQQREGQAAYMREYRARQRKK